MTLNCNPYISKPLLEILCICWIMSHDVACFGSIKLWRKCQLSRRLRDISVKANNPFLTYFRDEKNLSSLSVCIGCFHIYSYIELRRLKLAQLIDITFSLQVYGPYSFARRIKMDVNRNFYGFFCSFQGVWYGWDKWGEWRNRNMLLLNISIDRSH
jgi:hypothetical protein